MKKNILRLISYIPAWVLTTLCLIAILWLTLNPSPTPDVDLPLFPGADKLIHAIMFGALTFTACFDYEKFRGNRSRKSILTPLIMAAASTATGIGIEFLQQAMALGRSFEIADMAADAVGAFSAASIVILYIRNHNSSNHRRSF